MTEGAWSSLRGHLLIASPGLLDPNFHRAVVFVTEHNEEGAMGLVLNRPSDIAVSRAVPQFGVLVERDAPVYIGGPVQREAVTALAELEDPAEAAAIAMGDIGFLRADADPDALAGEVRRARIFAGYSGWGAGQLESELEESAWIVERAEPDDVFTLAPDVLWSAVLRRKGGTYAVIAMMPPDPSVN